MTSPIPQCRGFTHPFVLLVRSTLRSRSSPESYTRSIASLPLRQQRSFSSCHAPCNKKTTLPPTSTKPATSPLADKIKNKNLNVDYAQRLAMKTKPTILYEAAPNRAFLISSYTASLFCFTSAGINSWFNVFNLPPGISSWVPVGFGVVSFLFAALGTTFSMRPSSVIRSIQLLPKTASQAPGPGPQPVLLEIAVRRISLIPLPLKRIRVEPDKVVLLNRYQHRPVFLSKEEMAAKKLEDAKRRKAEREYELDHLMTAPFRDAGRASSTLLDNIRRGLTNEGFMPVFINGVRYKLDIEGGYALENGHVLDRLVTIQPDPELAQRQSQPQIKET
ncbi:hypothetical protein F4859DRAFT_510442 [Xylaria cf. heliscus]|nr:hypothetical protein F4859DRAFT_510442 [Xylaria cf. heliscus]